MGFVRSITSSTAAFIRTDPLMMLGLARRTDLIMLGLGRTGKTRVLPVSRLLANSFYTNAIRDNPKVSPWLQKVLDEEACPTKAAAHTDLKWARWESEGKVVSPPPYEKMGAILYSAENYTAAAEHGLNSHDSGVHLHKKRPMTLPDKRGKWVQASTDKPPESGPPPPDTIHL